MSEFYELTNDYYLNCTSNCASELAEIRETLINLDSEYSSKDEEIAKLKAQIKELRVQIKTAKKEKRVIAKEISKNERYLEVDVRFLEDLNRGMANRGGKHLVDYQGRHVKTK